HFRKVSNRFRTASISATKTIPSSVPQAKYFPFGLNVDTNPSARQSVFREIAPPGRFTIRHPPLSLTNCSPDGPIALQPTAVLMISLKSPRLTRRRRLDRSAPYENVFPLGSKLAFRSPSGSCNSSLHNSRPLPTSIARINWFVLLSILETRKLW